MRLNTFAATLLALAALTHAPDVPATPIECAKHLAALGVSGEEARYWSRRARSRDAFFAISSMLQMANEAPAEVWDLLAIARLSEIPELVPLADEVVDLIASYPGVGELEILFDTEVRELRPTITGLVALGRFGAPDAQEWLGRVMRVPARMFVLARTLDEFGRAEYDVARGVMRPRGPVAARLILARARRWMDAQKSFRTVVRSSRLLATSLIRERMRFYRTEKGAVLDDAEALTEWALDQLVPGDAHANFVPDPLPAHWPHFLAHVFDSIDSPPHREPKRVDGFTAGETILFGTLSSSVQDIVNAQLEKHGEHDRWTAGGMMTDWIMVAYPSKMVNLIGGARVLTLLADAVGVTMPSAADLKKHFAAKLRARLGTSLHDYYPLAGRGPNGENEPVEPLSEPFELAPVLLGSDAEPASCPIVTADVAETDALPPFRAIVPDRAYHIRFARPHVKFTGAQRVVFTRHALDAIRDHAEVPPDEWIEALRMGMALPHGQRGVKMLTFGAKRGTTDGLPAHIKLVLSNYRVTGDFCGGVWTFTDLVKGH